MMILKRPQGEKAAAAVRETALEVDGWVFQAMRGGPTLITPRYMSFNMAGPN